MDHPKDVGDRTTLAVMLALRAAGLAVLIPFGENTRYDLAIDDGSRLVRVQCKTGRLRGGAIRFSTCSTYGHHVRPQTSRRAYAGEIEYFAVHCLETDAVYLVPIEDVPTAAQAFLRVSAARNGQRKGIRFAANYEIARIKIDLIGGITAAPGGRPGAG